MKKLKTIICLLCISALMLSLTGCIDSFLTASKEDVLAKLIQYTNGRTPTSAAVNISFSMDAVVNDDPASIQFSMKNQIMQSSETNSYAEGEYVCIINDAEIRNNIQVYNFTEDEKLLTFTYTENSDYWARSETALPEPTPAPVATPTPTPAPEESQTKLPDSLAQLLKKEPIEIPQEYTAFLLEENTQFLDDTEVYILTQSVSGESCAQMLQNSLISDAISASLQGADIKSLDLSPITADVTLSVNKESGALTQAEIVISGLNLRISDILSMLPENAGAVQYNSITISPVRIKVSDIGYDSVTIPTVTEDARILASQNKHIAKQEDGSYILLQYKDAVTFTPQTDWTVTGSGYSFADFRNENNSRAVHFELYRNTSAEAFFSLVETGMIPAMEAVELTPVAAAGEPIGAYQTHCITSNGVNVYSACRIVGDSLLGIYVQDSTGADISAVLTPILNSVEDCTVTY